jgi:hypothetical protein
MIEAFVIAFIHCTGQSCAISYPRPDTAYASYNACKVQLPEATTGKGFDGETFEGPEIACVEVPVHAAAEGWVALEASNLHKSPSSGSDVIATVKRGTSFQVLAQEGKWLSVQTAGGTRDFLWSDRAQTIHATSLAPSPKRSSTHARPPPKEKSRLASAKLPQFDDSPSQPPPERELRNTRTAASRN